MHDILGRAFVNVTLFLKELIIFVRPHSWIPRLNLTWAHNLLVWWA